MNCGDVTAKNFWEGPDYKCGIDDKRIVIVGFSHHRPRGNESDHFTAALMPSVKRGEIPFFNQIAGYFDRDSTDGFWDQVAFFNTLPGLVGDSTERYGAGSREQRAAVPNRVKAILEKLKPHKALVFTKKGWDIWPAFDGLIPEGRLMVPNGDDVWFGSYQIAMNEVVLAYQVRHPQFSRTDVMRSMVATALKHEI